jgi:hypothetical protein
MMKEIGFFSETLGDLNHMRWLPAQEDLITSSGTGYTNNKFQCTCFTSIKHLNIQSRSKKKWGNWSNWRKYIIL